jgi:hypothetical protein
MHKNFLTPNLISNETKLGIYNRELKLHVQLQMSGKEKFYAIKQLIIYLL